jgi:hypothetical protein
LSNSIRELQGYLFRSLMFEAEAESFRTAGLRVGADLRATERNLLDEALAPFSIDLRNEALRMMRTYALLYCFENSVRQLITERLQERHGTAWWESKVTSKVKDFAKSRQEAAEKESWLAGEKKEIIGFIEFGHLADIIANN